MTAEEAVVRRIRVRSAWIGAGLAAVGFAFGWRRGVSLTICAAVVIFSFLVFEKLTVRLVSPADGEGKRKVRALIPLLLVTAVSVGFLVVALQWNGFDPIAGFAGLSAVVLAVAGEIFQGKSGKE